MACYVISNDAHIASNEYKFGYTDNTNKDKLLSRYNTQLNDPKILLFYYTPNAKDDETSILVYFKDFRCKNAKGNYNEWLKIDFEVLKEYLDKYFSKEEYADFRNMNLKQIELKVETLRLKVAETQLKTANKEWKILVSKAIKDEEYLLELLDLHAKPDNAIDLDYYYERYKDIYNIFDCRENKIMIDFVDSILIDKLIPLDEKFMSDFSHLYLNTLVCEYPDNMHDILKPFLKYEYSNIEIEKLLDNILTNISKYINCYNLNKKYLIYINNKWIEFRFNEVIEFLKYFIIGIIFDNITKEYKEIKNCRSRDMNYLIHNIYNTFTYNIDSSYYEEYINIYDKKKCIELLLKE